jgi:hypothetical protein
VPAGTTSGALARVLIYLPAPRLKDRFSKQDPKRKLKETARFGPRARACQLCSYDAASTWTVGPLIMHACNDNPGIQRTLALKMMSGWAGQLSSGPDFGRTSLRGSNTWLPLKIREPHARPNPTREAHVHPVLIYSSSSSSPRPLSDRLQPIDLSG